MIAIRKYLSFLKVGFLAFGGGISMLPYLEEIGKQYLGLDDEGFLQIMAISQSFPGAMGVNGAAIIGYRMGGWYGATLAIIGVTLPSVVCATVLFYLLDAISNTKLLNDILNLLKAALVGIIIGMVVNLGRKSWVGVKPLLIGLIALLVFYVLKANPAFILTGAGLAGFWLLRDDNRNGALLDQDRHSGDHDAGPKGGL